MVWFAEPLIYNVVCYQTFEEEKVSVFFHGVGAADPLTVQEGAIAMLVSMFMVPN